MIFRAHILRANQVNGVFWKVWIFFFLYFQYHLVKEKAHFLFNSKAMSHSGGIFAHSFISLNGSPMQNKIEL